MKTNPGSYCVGLVASSNVLKTEVENIAVCGALEGHFISRRRRRALYSSDEYVKGTQREAAANGDAQ